MSVRHFSALGSFQNLNPQKLISFCGSKTSTEILTGSDPNILKCNSKYEEHQPFFYLLRLIKTTFRELGLAVPEWEGEPRVLCPRLLDYCQDQVQSMFRSNSGYPNHKYLNMSGNFLKCIILNLNLCNSQMCIGLGL